MDYMWKDFYYKKAKEHGFKSRSAFKLIEINDKHRILKSGRKVLDLGCAPGGWLQIACSSVGEKGFVWGVDKVKFDFPQRKNLKILIADIENETERRKIQEAIGGKIDVVISDIAPKLTGISDTDNARIFNLTDTALEICRMVLKQNGDFLIKAFHSNELNEFRAKLKNEFETVNLIVPKAKRRSSSEIYILARGFRIS